MYQRILFVFMISTLFLQISAAESDHTRHDLYNHMHQYLQQLTDDEMVNLLQSDALYGLKAVASQNFLKEFTDFLCNVE